MPARLALTLLVAVVAAAAARADVVFSLDVISPQRYPATVGDNLVYFINDRGVSAGYVSPAANGFAGPFLPLTYTSPGGFNVLPGLQSRTSNGTATGISNTGTVVGNLLGPQFPYTPFLYANGAGRPIVTPPGFTRPWMNGVNRNGVAFGYMSNTAGQQEVFTTTNGTLTRHPVSAPGLSNFVDLGSMNDAGLLSVVGSNDDFSTVGFFLLNTNTNQLTRLTVPSEYLYLDTPEVTSTGLFGLLYDEEFNQSRYAWWNLDGSFRGYFDLPDGTVPDSMTVNDLGQAVALAAGRLWTFAGRTWTEGQFIGSDGYRPFFISDFNSNGQFVGGAYAPNGSAYFGFVATVQTPEPASVAVFGGLLAAGAWAGRRRRK